MEVSLFYPPGLPCIETRGSRRVLTSLRHVSLVALHTGGLVLPFAPHSPPAVASHSERAQNSSSPNKATGTKGARLVRPKGRVLAASQARFLA